MVSSRGFKLDTTSMRNIASPFPSLGQPHWFALLASSVVSVFALGSASAIAPPVLISGTEVKSVKILPRQDAAQPKAPVGAVVVTYVADRIRVSTADGQRIIDDWIPRLTHPSPAMKTSTRVHVDPNGFDVIYDLRNTGQSTLEVESLPTPITKLGTQIDRFDFLHSGWTERLVGVGTRRQASYPSELYSPIAVMTGNGITMGISLQYPVLDYKHDVSISTTGVGYDTWRTDLRIGGAPPSGNIWLNNPAKIAPGASRSYTVSFRFNSANADWRKTITPYLAYFQGQYGRVTYNLNPQPIRGFALAATDVQSPANPNGWYAQAGDPTRNGYRTAANAVQTALGSFSRVVVWAPTGLVTRNGSMNYPPQFTSRWTNPDRGSQALRDGPSSFRSIRCKGEQSWGLWWGHAAETSPGWDTPPLRPVNPSDAGQRALVLKELRGATDAGARIIGLDAFAHCHDPLWNLVGLLALLKENAPNVAFCSEGRSCDVLHRLVPTWIDAYSTRKTSAGDEGRIKGRFVLADLLLPGHETWVGMCYDRCKEPTLNGPTATTAAITTDVRRIMDLGYVPVLFFDLNLQSSTSTR